MTGCEKTAERPGRIVLETMGDDEILPELDETATVEQIADMARTMARCLEAAGVRVETLVPRWWNHPYVKEAENGGETARLRDYALWRTLRTADVARILGASRIRLTGRWTEAFPGNSRTEAVALLSTYAPDLGIALED